MPVALTTGASQGRGRALGTGLAERGWDLVLDARTGAVLEDAAREARPYGTRVVAVAGDVTDAVHRAELVAAARARRAGSAGEQRERTGCGAARAAGGAAGSAGDECGGGARARAGSVATAAGGGGRWSRWVRTQRWRRTGPGVGAGLRRRRSTSCRRQRRRRRREAGLRVWAVDPGDMRTGLYAAAVPDDDAGRPEPGAAVPAFLRPLDERPASGRCTASALLGREVQR
ncbi:hypothetical protein GCM10010446_05830 [Streptomyces enissocaesilis]|uniref:Uncharacterized protein n=1 Tax=Streptomyces enissocaesilis TaxID=332589 RepID=A0ABP6J811_9ACTN